jgi:MoaA/NifB/PqqE/SkfB family radical SAM enzyme
MNKLKLLFKKIVQNVALQKKKHSFGNNNLKRTNNFFYDAPFPEFCTITITDSCFFKCKMCNFWKPEIRHVNKEISPKLWAWKRFLYGLSKIVPKKTLEGEIMKRFTIIISGGEPLSSPYILELIKFSSSLGFRTVVPSNGFLINKKMAEKLHKAGLTQVNLSLDSMDENIHDNIRGFKGAYKGVMRAIENLNKYEYPVIGIGSIIQESTYKGIPKLVDWVQNNDNLDGILLMAVTQPNNIPFDIEWQIKQEFSGLWPKETKEVTAVINKLIKTKKSNIIKVQKGLISDKIYNNLPQLYAFKNYFKDPLRFVKNENPCNFDTVIGVAPDGHMFLCHHYNFMGNIMTHDIKDVWYSENAHLVRQKIKICRTNCHELINCYFKEEYPFKLV